MIGAVARAARARTLSLGYRLAPEHPFPAAAAYHGWVLRPCDGGCYVITEETQQGFVVSVGRAILRRGLLKWHQRWLEGLSSVAARSGPAGRTEVT
jgi:hypothetical protein